MRRAASLGAARRRPVLGRLHVADAFRDVGLDRAAGLRVDLARQFTFPYALAEINSPLARSST